MSVAIHCDKTGCDSWSRLVSPTSMQGWVEYVAGDETNHFCSAWHCMQWLADWAEPVIEVP